MYCKYCGSEVSPSAKFCPKCGKKLNGTTAQNLAKEANGKVQQSVDVTKDNIKNTESAEEIRDEVKQSAQSTKENNKNVDEKKFIVENIKQKVANVNVPTNKKGVLLLAKKHKVLTGIFSLVFVFLIFCFIQYNSQDEVMARNSEKMIDATVEVIQGNPTDISSLPVSQELLAHYRQSRMMSDGATMAAAKASRSQIFNKSNFSVIL